LATGHLEDKGQQDFGQLGTLFDNDLESDPDKLIIPMIVDQKADNRRKTALPNQI